MKINDKYEIKSTDERNVVLIENKINDKKNSGNYGKIYDKTVGYYSNTSEALKGLIKKEINGTGLIDYETIVNKINELYEYVDKVCK